MRIERKKGGQDVKPGFYWNLGEWSLAAVSGKRGPLPGDETQSYVRVPVPVMLALAPAMGGLFVAFLPFIGFALVIDQVVRRARSAARRGARVEQPVKAGSRRA